MYPSTMKGVTESCTPGGLATTTRHICSSSLPTIDNCPSDSTISTPIANLFCHQARPLLASITMPDHPDWPPAKPIPIEPPVTLAGPNTGQGHFDPTRMTPPFNQSPYGPLPQSMGTPTHAGHGTTLSPSLHGRYQRHLNPTPQVSGAPSLQEHQQGEKWALSLPSHSDRAPSISPDARHPPSHAPVSYLSVIPPNHQISEPVSTVTWGQRRPERDPDVPQAM